jgi:chromosome segregation ATPase
MESSEKVTDRENYLTAYIQKHETLLLEYVRKNVDFEIKLLAYMSSLQEANRRIEELSLHLNQQTELASQATLGVEKLSIEKNQLLEKQSFYESEIKDLESSLLSKTKELAAALDELSEIKQNNKNSSKQVEEIRRELQKQNEELNTLYRENEELKGNSTQPKKENNVKKKPAQAILPPDEF